MKVTTFVRHQSIRVVEYASLINQLSYLGLCSSMFLAVRFDQLKVTEWEVIYVFRNMSRANVSYLAPMTTILTESCLDTKSIRFTRANIDSVRWPANCAIGCAAGTICMAYLVERITSAGPLSPYLPIFRLLIWTSSQEHSCSALDRKSTV